MKKMLLPMKAFFSAALMSMMFFSTSAQTNVYDDVIATSPNHTSLDAALQQAGLVGALQNPSADLTVFAPDDAAFDDLAAALNTNIAGLLALPNLGDILQYHVLGQQFQAAALNNGQVETPLFTGNTVKITVQSGGNVFANQAQVNGADNTTDNGVVHSVDAVLLPDETVVDVAIDNNFSTLVTAVVTTETLLPVLTDPFGTFTVFAPNNTAFDDLATELNTTVPALLNLPNLADILSYHVLSTEVDAASVTNGGVVPAVSTTNTLKTTVTSTNEVFVNQAEVILADQGADNGIVHVLDAVVLPAETVADVAIDNGFTTLVTAVATAELLPVLTDPFAEFTVFAPDNAAFDAAVAALGITINDLLQDPDLADILTYHVLDVEVDAASVVNGDFIDPISTTNSIKTSVFGGSTYINQAVVTLADQGADNGIVHVIDEVILPGSTVVDAAVANGFTTLTAAVVAGELLPALSDPYAQYTIFAPTDGAFDTYVMDAGITLQDLLQAPNLQDVLLYHALDTEVLSSALVPGAVTTMEGGDVVVNLTGGVFINDAEVTQADVDVDNGVVHEIDKVLDPATASLDEITVDVNLYPNPATEFVTITADQAIESIQITSLTGAVLKSIDGTEGNNKVDVSDLAAGQYLIVVNTAQGSSSKAFNVSSRL